MTVELAPEHLPDLMPFAAHLGISFSSVAPDEVVAHLQWRTELTTAGGLMHGGALMTLADCAGAACAFVNLSEGAQTTTTSSNTVFLRAAREGRATATARPLHVGRTTIAVVTTLTDDDGRVVAQVTQSQAVLHP